MVHLQASAKQQNNPWCKSWWQQQTFLKIYIFISILKTRDKVLVCQQVIKSIGYRESPPTFIAQNCVFTLDTYDVFNLECFTMKGVSNFEIVQSRSKLVCGRNEPTYPYVMRNKLDVEEMNLHIHMS